MYLKLSRFVLTSNINHQNLGLCHLLFHSDQGTQYTSFRFQYALQKNNVRQSLSKLGTLYDNVVMERFFRSIKYECLKHKTFQNIDELRETYKLLQRNETDENAGKPAS